MQWSDSLETNHNFNFKDSKILVNIHDKKHWKIIESSIISNYMIKQRPRLFFWGEGGSTSL